MISTVLGSQDECMGHTALDYARYYRTNKGHGEGIIDMKLERSFSVVIAVMR